VKPCTCSNMVVTKHQKRISGPLLDRIDIHIEVPRIEYEKLSEARLGESSAAVRERVETARERQRKRFEGLDGIAANADMRPAEVRKFCELDETGRSLKQTAMSQLQLSARAYHRVLKLARTMHSTMSRTWRGVKISGRATWQRRCMLRDRPRLNIEFGIRQAFTCVFLPVISLLRVNEA
jgi:hypothetical protein